MQTDPIVKKELIGFGLMFLEIALAVAFAFYKINKEKRNKNK